MRVTDIRFKKVNNDKYGKLKAIASVVLDDCLVIHDIKVIDGDKGRFVGMPSRNKYNVFNGDEKFMDIVHPINTPFREYLTREILDSYEVFLELCEKGFEEKED